MDEVRAAEAFGGRRTRRRLVPTEALSPRRRGSNLAARTPAWYVARVREGSEEAAARDCRKLVDSGLLHDCFVPRVQFMQKRQGEWRLAERLLYPGYVFAIASDPRRLDRRLGALSFPVRLVGRQERSYVPLAAGEQRWFEAVLDEGRMLRASTGVIEDGALVVREGPLRGFEQRVKKLNRHKALALVQVDMPDRAVLLRAGLAVTSRT
ncbi:transcription termination/antitermination NusG family protein [Adlercreutzia sp. ZJ242]|uniref:transcription termination/antitermination NusG family protein n=1 Tax=Adlercreutzia sp. ZJ242 TaxID=2709409 RepID=UPI00197E9EE6|nr:transcription termination/antitermination NusG family protein [Adlercreutzia sp. ZJ242]